MFNCDKDNIDDFMLKMHETRSPTLEIWIKEKERVEKK